MTIHRKLEKSLFEQLTNEEKHEIQFTECQVHAGDTLVFEEWDQESNSVTGRQLTTVVTAVQPVTEVPAGSIDEATEHGSITVQFTPTQALSVRS